MHIHPAVVKIAINAKGPEGVVLVTDSMHAAGHGQGEYDLGGYKIVIEGGGLPNRRMEPSQGAL